MKLTILSTECDMWGLHTIKINLNGRHYNYELSSQHAVDLVQDFYRAGKFGRCLALLNKFHNTT
jgi:hypothetical protein